MALLHLELMVAIEVDEAEARKIGAIEAVILAARGLERGAKSVDPQRVAAFEATGITGNAFMQVTIEDDNAEFPNIGNLPKVEEFLAN